MQNERRNCKYFDTCTYWLETPGGCPLFCTQFKHKDEIMVVRCKDCDWFRDGGICVNPKAGKSFYGCPVPKEHFCSYGERRSDGTRMEKE